MNALPEQTHLERPRLQRTTASPMANVWAVLRRELGARFFTSGYVWSTIVFAAMALFAPFFLPSTSSDAAIPVAVTSEATYLEPALTEAGFDVISAASSTEREALLREGNVDAVLFENENSVGWVLLSEPNLSPTVLTTIQTRTTFDALQSLAQDTGASPSDLQNATLSSVVTPEFLSSEGDNKFDVMIALAFGLVIVFVVVLWGATMAADVVQEKATRVVEILIATIRPWQLLTGKVAALTIIGLVQIAIVIAAAAAGMYFFTDGIDLPLLPAPVVITGVISVLIGVPLLAALMAAMAARVEHQEDLGTATQPVYLLLMGPFAAAVYVGMSHPTGIAMHILSLAPLTNIFAMPARVAAAPVPLWEIGFSFAIALATLAAMIWLAGRIYTGSILRAGSTVALRDALAKQ